MVRAAVLPLLLACVLPLGAAESWTHPAAYSFSASGDAAQQALAAREGATLWYGMASDPLPEHPACDGVERMWWYFRPSWEGHGVVPEMRLATRHEGPLVPQAMGPGAEDAFWAMRADAGTHRVLERSVGAWAYLFVGWDCDHPDGARTGFGTVVAYFPVAP